MPRGEGKWERAATERLIELYKSHSCLYAVASPEYPIKDKRIKALRSIVEDISRIRPNTTIKDLKKKINILRTQYLQERKKFLSHMRNGIADEYSPTLWCYDQLRFLEPYSRIKELSPSTTPYNQVAIVEVAVSPSNCYMSEDECSPPNLSGDAGESEEVDPLTDSPSASLHESECVSPSSHMSPSLPCHSNSVPATADSTSRTATPYSSSGRTVILCPSSSESSNPVLLPSLSSLITSSPVDSKSSIPSRLTSVLKSAQSISSQTVGNLSSSVSITPSLSQNLHHTQNNSDTSNSHSHSHSVLPSSPLVSLNSMMTPLPHQSTSSPQSSMKYMPSHIRPSSASTTPVNAASYHPITSSSTHASNDYNRKRKGDVKEMYNVAALVHEAKRALQLEKPQTQEEAFGVFVARTLQEMKNKNKKMMCIAKITDILLKENEDE